MSSQAFPQTFLPIVERFDGSRPVKSERTRMHGKSPGPLKQVNNFFIRHLREPLIKLTNCVELLGFSEQTLDPPRFSARCMLSVELRECNH